MTRTTPPRPVDIAAVFPELAPLARTTTRLHPRQGKPTPQDSSVGGPLLWPIDEPWPYCDGRQHASGYTSLTTLADVRLLREMLAIAWDHPGPPGAILSDEERALVRALQKGRHSQTDEPIAMIPVAQLYARDIPDLHPPEGCDLLQVLWCPFDHFDPMPKAKLVWRSSSSVTTVLSEPPQPIVVQSEYYIPEPCVIHPEQVIEYPAPLELDEVLRERIEAWSEREKAGAEAGSAYDEAESAYYQNELSVAPGWKVGGWAPWSFRDPYPMICTVCGAEMKPLLTISSDEWDLGSGSWIPIEDQALDANPPPYPRTPWLPTLIKIGRAYHMQIYICPTSVDHPHAELVQ